MNEFDASKPQELSGIMFPLPVYWLQGSQSLQVGNSYAGGGAFSGIVTKLQMMPQGHVVATVKQTQGSKEQISREAYVVFWGNGMCAEVKRSEAVLEVEVAPTAAQEKARTQAAKAVQA